MTPDSWARVDQYLAGELLQPDPVLDETLRASDAAGLPAINVSPAHGQLLHILARLCGAQRILEIGTLGGYSTIWLARALPAAGLLITLEADETHATVARANITRAGLGHVVDIRLGRAIDSLRALAASSPDPFDLVFIDADKVSTSEYFRWALGMSRRGTVIVVDNVVRKGEVADPNSPDPSVQAMQRFFALLKGERRATSTAIQTVGLKGYDGFAVVLVEEPGQPAPSR
jgi:predicted O-methyltransferase YrrM